MVHEPRPPGHDLELALGMASAILAITPLLPLAPVPGLVGLFRALRAAPSTRRRWAIAICGGALALSLLMVPLYLMFLDAAGVFRGGR